jgi:hypothetical protein
MDNTLRLAHRLAQRDLLVASLEPNLLPSRILPSVWPKVTRTFTYGDLKEKCEAILLEARRKSLPIVIW